MSQREVTALEKAAKALASLIRKPPVATPETQAEEVASERATATPPAPDQPQTESAR
jgi:hypothetical protein